MTLPWTHGRPVFAGGLQDISGSTCEAHVLSSVDDLRAQCCSFVALQPSQPCVQNIFLVTTDLDTARLAKPSKGISEAIVAMLLLNTRQLESD